MNTQKGKKAQNKTKGNQIAMPQTQGREVDASREIYQAKINKLLLEWFQGAIFPEFIPKEWVLRALLHVSDLSLKITFDKYCAVANKALSAIESIQFTFEEMDIVLQILSNVNASQLEVNLTDYLHIKHRLFSTAQNFETAFNENKERILAENPFEEKTFTFPDDLDNIESEVPVLNTVGEA